MSKILFVGLGHMGGPMAQNLIKAGHEVYGADLSDKARSELERSGGRPVSSLREFDAQEIEVVISMLPAGNHVRAVYTSEQGLPPTLPKECLLIDCSTIDVTTARAVGEGAVGRGFAFVDAPVSGGTAAAQAGSLTFMVGGKAEDFERAKPILDAMGKNIFHAGPLGNGQVAKICNNMLLAIHMVGTCEAFHLADKLGLDAQTFFDISSTASGQNWSMTSYCPVPGPVPSAPSNKDYTPGFTAAMMLKDLRLAQEAAQDARAATPLGAHAQSLYTLMESAGEDQLDFSAMMKLIDGSL